MATILPRLAGNYPAAKNKASCNTSPTLPNTSPNTSQEGSGEYFPPSPPEGGREGGKYLPRQPKTPAEYFPAQQGTIPFDEHFPAREGSVPATPPLDDAASYARSRSKTRLAAEVLDLQARLARADGELARLRAVAPQASLSGPPVLAVRVPVLIVSEANRRDHHHQKAKRVRSHREAVGACLLPHHRLRSELVAQLRQGGRLSVHFVRRAGGQLDDDNLANGCKAVRDAVAAWLGCDDGPRGPLRFSYDQEAHKRWSKVPELLLEIRSVR